MLPPSTLTTTRILELFGDEIIARAGRITDTFQDGQRLITRSVLPHVEEVRRGDRVQGGVALKANDDRVCLYPYVFRQVCRNGAIIAQTLAVRSLENLHEQEPETALQYMHEGIAACCAPEVFLNTVHRMRTACEIQADLALYLMPLLSRLHKSVSTKILSQIMDQFFREGDQSQFGLANAVTAVARGTEDADLRWNLEEFGGGVAVGTVPRHPADGGRAVTARSRRAVAVG